jgi:hypothetical protein
VSGVVLQAIDSPSRVDTHVVNNLARTLASYKRQEDKLGPCQVLNTACSTATMASGR